MRLATELEQERKRHAAAQKALESLRDELSTLKQENHKLRLDLSFAQKTTADATRRLSHLIQSVPVAIALFGPDDRLLVMNCRYAQLFANSAAVKPGTDYATLLELMTDQDLVDTQHMDSDTWRNMMLEHWQLPDQGPITLPWCDGEYIQFVKHRGRDGETVSLGSNITQDVLRDQELAAARAEVEAANRAKTAFLANMSHEIRTPMNGVVAMAELLAEAGLSDENQLYVETIKNSGEALLVIINDILEYSKIDADKLVLRSEPFDLERCIHDVIMLLQPSARDKGVGLVLDYDLFLPNAYEGDPGRIRQVLTNLMGNAVKFTSAGHVLVRVTGVPNYEAGTTDVRITIEDTGIGISADKIDHIFGDFNQVENQRNRQFDGTGLGLAISNRLIELMKGNIWVTSEEGVGSVFGFHLPLRLCHVQHHDRPNVSEVLRQVMVVDDVEANRVVLWRQLEQMGLAVLCCESGAEALENLSGIDLILSNHMMPEMDGLELAKAVRDRGSAVPFILLSTDPGRAQDHPSRHHVTAFLQKPVPRFDLLRQLQAFGSFDSPIDAHVPHKVQSRRMVVLAAEDNKTNQLVLRKMMQPANVDLHVVNNGLEAVDRFNTVAPDLVFMDISMPKMDGKEATLAIRAMEQEKGTRATIVALTAHAIDEDNADMFGAGLDYYLTKPLRKREIFRMLKSACPLDVIPPFQEKTDHTVQVSG